MMHQMVVTISQQSYLISRQNPKSYNMYLNKNLAGPKWGQLGSLKEDPEALHS